MIPSHALLDMWLLIHEEIKVNPFSGNGLLPDDTKWLTKTGLSYSQWDCFMILRGISQQGYKK